MFEFQMTMVGSTHIQWQQWLPFFFL